MTLQKGVKSEKQTIGSKFQTWQRKCVVVGNNGNGKATNADDLWQKLWKLWQQTPNSQKSGVGFSNRLRRGENKEEQKG